MSTPKLFIHAKFEVPQTAVDNGSGNDQADEGDDGKNNVMIEGTTTTTKTDDGQTITDIAIKHQYFDASNYKPALIGLPEGVDPVKPEAGDYSYSGMHDHGPLPPPKEGGEFAQIIGLVNAAKKQSDSYLTELIEKEKEVAVATQKNQISIMAKGDNKQKRKRK